MGGMVVASRIILTAPVPFPFLWTLDFWFGTWIWDLRLGLGLDNSRLTFLKIASAVYIFPLLYFCVVLPEYSVVSSFLFGMKMRISSFMASSEQKYLQSRRC